MICPLCSYPYLCYDSRNVSYETIFTMGLLDLHRVMPRIFRIGVLLLVTLVFLTGCRQSAQPQPGAEESGVRITIDVPTDRTGEVPLVITLTDANNAPINGARIAVVGDMNHAGMTPVNGEAQNGTDGRYEVPFNWTMGGDWILTVTVTLPDGRQVRETFNYTISS
jgi:hypothetical protein